MINKDGKLFGKISIIDIFVILAIAILAFGVYSRFFTGNEKVETASSRIEYTMKVKEVRMGTYEALRDFKGPITSDTTKEYMGDIVDVSYTKSQKGVELVTGKMKESEVPEKYDVTLTIQVDGNINQSGYYTATNQVLTAGSNHVFYSKAAKTTGTIMDVREIK